MKHAFHLLLACIGLSLAVTAAPAKPNIVIIFTDDQGYADLACYGNTKNKTPRLDQLAKEGTRFTSFYSQTVCGPSRSALLTGRQPIRSGGWGMPADEITWAELITKAGYQTACIGKWDVSNRKPIIPRMPNAQGFDYYFGALGANDAGVVHLHENNQSAGSTRDMGGLIKLYTDKSIDYLKNKRDPKKPFVLYLAHTMMHTIIDASPKFRGKSKGGLYGDVVEEFDFETGRLLDTLQQLKLDRDTIVILTSDNGGVDFPSGKSAGTPPTSNSPWRSGKGTLYEGGIRVPLMVHWPGITQPGSVCHEPVLSQDFYSTLATGIGVQGDEVARNDGVNLLPLLKGEQQKLPPRVLFWHYPHYYPRMTPASAVRDGSWKLIHYYEDDRVELFDLANDRSERTDLSTMYPTRAKTLKQQLDQWRESVGANIPKPNPDWNEK